MMFTKIGPVRFTSIVFIVFLAGILGRSASATTTLSARGSLGPVALPAGWVRLPGYILPALEYDSTITSASVGRGSASATQVGHEMTLTLTLKVDDQAGFDRYMKRVYDPHSKFYRKFLTPVQLANRYGPSQSDYNEVLGWLHQQGFTLVEGAKNRLTMIVRGERSQVQRAFAVRIGDYQIHGRRFYANDNNPALPAAIASHVRAIGGLTDFAQSQPTIKNIKNHCPKAGTCNNAISKVGNIQDDINCVALGAGGAAAVGAVGAAATASSLGAAMSNLYIFIYTSILGVSLDLGGVQTAVQSITSGTPPSLFGSNPCTHFSNFFSDVGTIANAGAFSPLAVRSGRRFANSLASGAVAHASAASLGTSAAPRIDGTGQTIGLLEFDAFNQSDVLDYLTLLGQGSRIANLSVVPVNGGVASPGSGVDEVLLDIDTVMSIAPGAKVKVYEAPFNGHISSYTQILNQMINDGVNVISISWASCEDQVSQSDALALDSVLQSAAAAGISVFAGTGDSGSTCLDGSPGTISVPADSPNVTAVGGTSQPGGAGPGGTYTPETWWGGANAVLQTGQGGFGASRYFAKPAYQDTENTGPMRSIPDVSILADPENGTEICDANNGGCPTDSIYGGTSMAAPEWAALAALLNQTEGRTLGAFNPLLYRLAGTEAFHSPASMGSDFAHVGLGSPNANVLNRLSLGQALGPPDPNVSSVEPLASPSTGSFALVPTSNSTYPSTATTTEYVTIATPADGATQAGVLVTLRDANGNTVTGKAVTLSASGGNAIVTPSSAVTTDADGNAQFTVTDLAPETVTFTATDATDGIQLTNAADLTFVVPPATSANLNVFPTSVNADGQSTATLTVTLQDSRGFPTPGKLISISQGQGNSVISGPNPAVTDSGGQVQFTVTDDQSQTVTYSAVDVWDGNLPIPGSGTSVTFSNAVASDCTGSPPSAAPGYTLTTFATGFPAGDFFANGVNYHNCPGVNSPTFLPSGSVIAPDSMSGGVYSLPVSGGSASPSEVTGNAGQGVGGFTLGKDGNFYTTQGGNGNGVVEQIDPVSGAVVRTLFSGLRCPADLSVDPLTGDLFFDDGCTGAGSDDPSLWRISNPYSTNPTLSTYATLTGTANAGMAFAPDGTIYVLVGGASASPQFSAYDVDEVSGTGAPQPAVVTQIPNLLDYFGTGIAVGKVNSNGGAQTLELDVAGTSGGQLETVNITTNPLTVDSVLATGKIGVGIIGPDGCNYIGASHVIYKLAPISGSCGLTPTSLAPSIALSPATVTTNPQQGGMQSFTATLKNVTSPSGVPVTFAVQGANPQNKLVDTDANGQAVLTYQAVSAGADTITASAVVPSSFTPPSGTTPSTPTTQTLFSNPAQVTWVAGQHATFLSLNQSPTTALVGKPVTLVAQLVDESTASIVPIAGENVHIAAGNQSCDATTDAQGVAQCTLTLVTPGTSSLTATFSGIANSYAPSAAKIQLQRVAPSVPPTVTIAVSPTSVAAGSPATLTWSSTHATSCSASGAWSGSEATSGTQAVTPTSSGSLTYTLTCSGNGGSTAASAVLAATLVAVTVTAHSGGGAITWPALVGLVCLVLWIRVWYPRRSVRAIHAAGGLLLLVVLVVGAAGAARADSSSTGSGARPFIDHLYLGLGMGDFVTSVHAADIEGGLRAEGYPGIVASTHDASVGGTLYLGYEVARHVDIELGFSHRATRAAALSGTVGSTAAIAPLLRDTSGLIRDYGNIFSVSVRMPFSLAPRVSVYPRLGVFLWNSKVTVEADGVRLASTHRGGGLVAGVGASYRLWRSLALGIAADYFDGRPRNTAALYSGTVEWHFGR